MDGRGFVIGLLAGGWLATLVVLFVGRVGLPAAQAEPPVTNSGPVSPNEPPGAGPTVNPLHGPSPTRGVPTAVEGMSDSNNRAIAISASIGSGESAVYYFDTISNRLCVYQYKAGGRGGLRLLAARYIDYDLKLESYRDLSEKSPRDMREAWEAAMGQGTTASRSRGALPTKKVELPGALR